MDTLDKRRILWFLLACAFAEGVLAFFLRGSPEVERLYRLVGNIISIIGTVRWFVLDARLHEYRMPQRLILYLVLCAFLAAPYYFFQTRRSDSWKSCLKSLAFWLVWAVVYTVGNLGSQGVADLARR